MTDRQATGFDPGLLNQHAMTRYVAPVGRPAWIVERITYDETS